MKSGWVFKIYFFLYQLNQIKSLQRALQGNTWQRQQKWYALTQPALISKLIFYISRPQLHIQISHTWTISISLKIFEKITRFTHLQMLLNGPLRELLYRFTITNDQNAEFYEFPPFVFPFIPLASNSINMRVYKKGIRQESRVLCLTWENSASDIFFLVFLVRWHPSTAVYWRGSRTPCTNLRIVPSIQPKQKRVEKKRKGKK